MKEELSYDDICSRISNSLNYVEECKLRVAQDQFLDLQGLETLVQKLCADAQALPAENAANIAKNMEKLLESLNDLEKNIRAKIGE